MNLQENANPFMSYAEKSKDKIRLLNELNITSHKNVVSFPKSMPLSKDDRDNMSIDKLGWDSHYERIERSVNFELFRDYNVRNPYIKRMLKFAKGKKRSLEFGSGKGGLSLILKRNYPALETHLLDFSQHAIEFSRELFGYYGCEAYFHLNNFLDLPFPNEYFDFIHGNTVLEHVEDAEKATKELTRVLAKGGNILVTVPNSFRRFDGHDLYHIINRFQYFSRSFYPRELEDLFLNNSCEIVERFGTGCIYLYPSYLPRFIYEKLRSHPKAFIPVKMIISQASNHTSNDMNSRFTKKEQSLYKLTFIAADKLWDPIQRKIDSFVSNKELLPASWYITIGIIAKKV